MDKQTIRIVVLALLSLHLLCSASIAQCKRLGCQKKCSIAFHCCICCINTDWCYTSSESCDRNCPDLFSHSNEMLAAATVTPETVLTRSAVRTDGLMQGLVPNEFGNCRV
ncbi:hypothetical protein VPH35_033622 [Triticum aestivum]